MNLIDNKTKSKKGKIRDFEHQTKFYLYSKMPIVLRVDGRAFSTLLRDCERPYDLNVGRAMSEVAYALCEEIQGAQMAYMQSDEVSILIHPYKRQNSQPWFGGNIQKMSSISASIASVTFSFFSSSIWGNCRTCLFDSRVFNVPENYVNSYFIDRQLDTIRNSVQLQARSLYSHKQCLNKNNEQLKQMCRDAGYPWENQPLWFQRGWCMKPIEVSPEDQPSVVRCTWMEDENVPCFICDPSYVNQHLECEESNYEFELINTKSS